MPGFSGGDQAARQSAAQRTDVVLTSAMSGEGLGKMPQPHRTPISLMAKSCQRVTATASTLATLASLQRSKSSGFWAVDDIGALTPRGFAQIGRVII
jgi:hypothetical protein